MPSTEAARPDPTPEEAYRVKGLEKPLTAENLFSTAAPAEVRLRLKFKYTMNPRTPFLHVSVAFEKMRLAP